MARPYLKLRINECTDPEQWIECFYAQYPEVESVFSKDHFRELIVYALETGQQAGYSLARRIISE